MFVELLGKLDIVSLDDVAAADLVHDVLPVNWKLELLNVEINTMQNSDQPSSFFTCSERSTNTNTVTDQYF